MIFLNSKFFISVNRSKLKGLSSKKKQKQCRIRYKMEKRPIDSDRNSLDLKQFNSKDANDDHSPKIQNRKSVNENNTDSVLLSDQQNPQRRAFCNSDYTPEENQSQTYNQIFFEYEANLSRNPFNSISITSALDNENSNCYDQNSYNEDHKFVSSLPSTKQNKQQKQHQSQHKRIQKQAIGETVFFGTLSPSQNKNNSQFLNINHDDNQNIDNSTKPSKIIPSDECLPRNVVSVIEDNLNISLETQNNHRLSQIGYNLCISEEITLKKSQSSDNPSIVLPPTPSIKCIYKVCEPPPNTNKQVFIGSSKPNLAVPSNTSANVIKNNRRSSSWNNIRRFFNPQNITNFSFNQDNNGNIQNNNTSPTVDEATKKKSLQLEVFQSENVDTEEGTKEKVNILRCALPEHDGEKVIMICVDAYCEAKYRLCCGYCSKLHSKHSNSLLRLEEFRQNVIKASKTLLQDKSDQQNDENHKVVHTELLYLCVQKQQKMMEQLNSHFDKQFKQIQRMVETKEQQILNFKNSFDKEFSNVNEKVTALINRDYLTLSNKDILRLYNLHKQPAKYFESKRINKDVRKKQLQELDQYIYEYYNNLQLSIDQYIVDSTSNIQELLDNCINANTQNPNHKFTKTNVLSNQNRTERQQRESSSPKKIINSTKRSTVEMTQDGIPGYKRITELPQWCMQMPHVNRVLKKVNKIQPGPIKPNAANLGITQNVKSENIYIGDWINYMKEGNGIEYCKKEQTYYEGFWKSNLKNGRGRLICKQDTMYEGEFENDKKSGFGILTQFGGKRYEGLWANDQPNGNGRQYFANGDIFEGNFEKGLKEGLGEYKYFDGSILTGIWSNDAANGTCTLTRIDGSSYQGQYRNGKKEGYGSFTWNDGKKYTGNWLDGVQNGQGQQVNQQGIIISGTWKQGKRIVKHDSDFSRSLIN